MPKSNNCVNPRDEEQDRRHDEQLHESRDRIVAFGQENGWDHPVVKMTVYTILTETQNRLIQLMDQRNILLKACEVARLRLPHTCTLSGSKNDCSHCVVVAAIQRAERQED